MKVPIIDNVIKKAYEQDLMQLCKDYLNIKN